MHPELNAYLNRIIHLEEQKVKEAVSAALTYENNAKMKRQEVERREKMIDRLKTLIAAS